MPGWGGRRPASPAGGGWGNGGSRTTTATACSARVGYGALRARAARRRPQRKRSGFPARAAGLRGDASTSERLVAAREVGEAVAAARDGFGAGGVQVVHVQMARYLNRAPQAFDVVFLDPPFAQPRLAEDACRRLAESGWLATGAHIYLEVAAHAQRPLIPPDWTLVREKASGDAHALLYATS